MAEEYGRLSLLAPLTLPNGVTAKEVVFFRPTCGMMTQILDTPSRNVQIERFVEHCVRAVNGNNGSGETLPFAARDLNTMDANELSSVISDMSMDADAVVVNDTGDGVTQPIIYTLQHKITMSTSDNAEVVTQFEFMARKLGDIAEFLDARGETQEFHTFMRTFAKPLGVKIPIIHDAMINALDFVDYLAIRRTIHPKFVNSRRRWRRASLPALSITTGHQVVGTTLQ